jgi:hypothetical protein
MKKRAQIAMEFILIIVISLSIIMGGIYLFRDYAFQSNDRIIQKKITENAIDLLSKARKMFYYGPPSKSVVDVDMPNQINAMYTLSVPGTEEYYLVFNVATSDGAKDIYFRSDVPLKANETTDCALNLIDCSPNKCDCFPERYFSQGIKHFKVEATDNCNNTVLPAAIPPGEREPFDIFIIIDASKSMLWRMDWCSSKCDSDTTCPGIGTGEPFCNGEDRSCEDSMIASLDTSKIAAVRCAASAFLDALGWLDDDRVGIVTYNTEESLVSELVTIGTSKDELKNSIMGITDILGTTRTDLGIYAAASNLSSSIMKKYIVLLSDGVSDTKSNTPAAAKFAADKGVVIFTIALPGISSAGESELQNIADLTKGRMFRVDPPSAMAAIFSQISGSLLLGVPFPSETDSCISIKEISPDMD